MSVTSASSIGVRVFPVLDFKNMAPIVQNKFYENWATSYDWDMLDMGYRLHVVSATLLMDNMENSKEEDCFVIDLGCGTGFVGAELRKRRMKGVLHALDADDSMLDVANKKRVYDELFLQCLMPGRKLRIADNLSYDGLTCIASLGSGHISPKMLPGLFKLLKRKGVAVFTVANHPRDKKDKEIVEDELRDLVERNVIKKICEKEEYYFQQGRTSREPENVATCTVYCYKKL